MDDQVPPEVADSVVGTSVGVPDDSLPEPEGLGDEVGLGEPESVLVVIAERDDTPVAMSFFLQGGGRLYGRYWGCYDEYHSLHFETCYYQGLDYCIEHRLQRFDSGAQGEHKISRGFEPITTYSAHWIKDKNFTKAFQHFVTEEKTAVHHYKQNAIAYLPFKKEL